MWDGWRDEYFPKDVIAFRFLLVIDPNSFGQYFQILKVKFCSYSTKLGTNRLKTVKGYMKDQNSFTLRGYLWV